VRAALPDEELEQLWGRERQPRTEMAAASARPTLTQLRQQQQRERRGGATRAGRGSGRRRGREEQPEEESDPASKRLRGDKTPVPPSPPRSTEEATRVPEHGDASNTAATSQRTPEGQVHPRGPGRTVATANREAAVGSPPSTPEVWSPVYAGRGGVMLTTADSVRVNPDVANVLMKGLALPADMSAVDALSLDDNFVELHSCLVKVRIVIFIPSPFFFPRL
jgi:hypothetical protein